MWRSIWQEIYEESTSTTSRTGNYCHPAKVRTGEITKQTFDMVVAAFEKDIPAFERFSISQNVGFNAVQLLKIHSTEQGLRMLDALQLASALAANRKKGLDLFVAADKTLLAVAEKESLPVLLV